MTPDVIHGAYRSGLEFFFQAQLASISTRDSVPPAAAEFAAGVWCSGDGTFKYPSTRPGLQTYNSRSPDCWFHHETRQYPSFIIEVANSQSTKSLQKLAEEYLLETNGEVRTVVGIDLDYNDKNRATVSVWRPRLDNEGNAVGVMCESLVGYRRRHHTGANIPSGYSNSQWPNKPRPRQWLTPVPRGLRICPTKWYF
jgi:hypothetical protein